VVCQSHQPRGERGGGDYYPLASLLDAIGQIVIAITILDVRKYLIEEVISDRKLRSAVEARQRLTQLLVIITIVVTVEASYPSLGPPNPRLAI
jgi:hypothetical protein